MRLPKRIFDFDERPWQLNGHTANFSQLLYSQEGSRAHAMPSPREVETRWSKKNRPEPQAAIISQGRWTCAAAATAMLLGVSHFDVKRAFAHSGWNNDDRGITEEVILKGVRHIGADLIKTPEVDDSTPCLILVESLNVKHLSHMVYWNGCEILDPNFGNPKRHYWGPEWGPQTINALEFFVLKNHEDINRTGISTSETSFNKLIESNL